MEALVAVGYAANVLQFVDCVCHALNVGSQLRRQGMTDFNMDLERSTKFLEHQAARIRSQQGAVTGIDEADQALDKLAEECMAIAKQLMSFIEKFKIERDLDPKTMAIAEQRPKHQDEVELERLISSIKGEVDNLEKVTTKRREEEKNRRKEEKRDAKHLVSKLKEIVKKRSEYLDEVELDKVRLDELISLRLKQREELEKVIIKRRGEGERGEERDGMEEMRDARDATAKRKIDSTNSEPKSKEAAKKRSKHPDEVELDRLNKLKQTKKEELKKVTKREDRFFERERNKAKRADDRAHKLSDTRRSINTLAKAIEFEWNKRKIEELAQKLDRIRNLLYSEVMLNIQKSVKSTKERADHSNQLLENISVSHHQYQAESQQALQRNHLVVETVLQAQTSQLLLMDDAASKRHDAIVQAINSFTNVLNGRLLFPALPGILTEADPSLKSAALNGYDAIENAVLAALYFRKMDIREAQVQEAYGDTCSWIFEDPEENQKPWSNFSRWLKEENGCYWIEGKAGCGKSTLMKFLRSDARTQAALEQWTGSDELITASYFFWMTGTALQKNQEGLLRSLLHTILTRRRDLIARVFPRQYDAMMTKLFANNSSPDIFFSCDNPGCSSSFEQPKQLEQHRRQHHSSTVQNPKHNNDAYGTLTLTELKKAFTTLARQNLKGFKICLFIDGLDEYVGDQLEIVDLFKTVTSHSSTIKAVISSRPEPTFIEAFHSSPKLRVEKLTAGDIDHYVRSKLLSHSKIQSLIYRGSELRARLVDSIATKACGVFLWVFLVVRSLLECLSDGSYPEDLERIIETYPEELHELYKHMFKRMKLSHRAEAFRLFQAIHRAQNIESRIPTALRLSFMERDQPDRSIHSPLKILATEELQERLSSFETRLRSRCCGLFEVQYFERLSSRETSHIREGRVTFLHRTVSDFLNDPGVRQVIEQETLQFSSEIYERLIASILYSFKAWRFFHLKKPYEWKKFIGEIRAFLAYCQRCEPEIGSKQIEYIEEFDRRLAYFWQVRALETRSSAQGTSLGNYQYHWAESLLGELHLKLTAEPDDDPLLSLAARYGLCTYVCRKLQTRSEPESNFLNTGGRSVVVRLSYWAMHHRSLRAQHFKIIESFLVSGLKINAKISGPTRERTLWQELLYLQSKSLPSQTLQLSTTARTDDGGQTEIEVSEVERLDVWTQLVELFLRFGAELDVSFKPFRGVTGERTAREVILEIMTTLETGQNLSIEESAIMQKSKIRIEQLLSEQPAKTAKINPPDLPTHGHSLANSICLPSKHSPINGDGPVSFQHRKSRPSTSSKKVQVTKPDGPAEPALPVVTRVDQPCYRCKAIEELTGIGFGPSEVFQAIERAGVGYDVPALTTWILDKKSDDTRPTLQSPATIFPVPCRQTNSKSRDQNQASLGIR